MSELVYPIHRARSLRKSQTLRRWTLAGGAQSLTMRRIERIVRMQCPQKVSDSSSQNESNTNSGDFY